MAIEKKRLGDILLDCNLITQDQLGKALSFQRERNVKLGQALIDLAIVTEDDIIWALGNQLNISFIHLNPQIVDPAVLKLISPEFSKEHRMMPLYKTGNQLSVCMVDPLEIEAIEMLAAKTSLDISVSICTRFDFEQTFSAVFGPLEVSEKPSEITPDKPHMDKGIPKGLEGPEKVINYILGQAISSKVDKIHFEPSDKGVVIRFRTASALIKKLEIHSKVHSEIINKLKALSQFGSQQATTPPIQTGHFRVTLSGRAVSVQSLFYPTVNGEMVILKLNYFGENAIELIGKSRLFLDEVAKFLHTHHGVLFITGPRESGKTVSSYFLLNSFDVEKKKLVTVENPVQATFPKVTQLQVGQNSVSSLQEGFSLALQLDPDVIYIDDLPSGDLAENVAFAGLGGKTVICSFIAHDASSSIIKLMELVKDPLVAVTSLCGFLSQRLIKKLCNECKKPYTPTDEQLSRLQVEPQKASFFQPMGCDECMNTGYSGRLLITEFIPASSQLKQLIINRNTYQEIFHFARKQNILSLEQGLVKNLLSGDTSFDEFYRLF